MGVANDAVNFLNSSIGSKVAPLWVILTVASVGILFGSLFSSGMMEIARSGVCGMFTFPQIMMLFLAVMVTDVILLDVFNTLGLPTSTTVSLIFELLGAAVAIVALVNILTKPIRGVLIDYINSGKALTIISGILISVVVAFGVGSIVMWISRVAFSFKYKTTFKYAGAIYGQALHFRHIVLCHFQRFKKHHSYHREGGGRRLEEKEGEGERIYDDSLKQ